MSPTQRTLEIFREMGFMVGVVERFLGMGKFGVRKDLFGIFDLVAVSPFQGIYGVQCFSTAWTQHKELYLSDRKMEAIKWIRSGGKIELWGWRKLKRKTGNRQYFPRVNELILTSRGLEFIELEIGGL